jgi:prepilin-type N-terminal cleavage/methylation domain-containing protein
MLSGMPATNRLASEHGFSLPELLVAIALGLIVAAGGATLLMIAVQSQPRAGDRSAQIQQGRTMIESISREVREGQTIYNPTPSGFEVLTYVHSATCGGAAASSAILCRVAYACDTDSCTRTERDADGTGTGTSRVVAEEITGPNVFTYQGDAANPGYVGITLAFPDEDGAEAVTLADGAELRNHVDLVSGA